MDRNIDCNSNFTHKKQSLSARRAWIEIHNAATLSAWACVALRKESVDRNLWWGVRKAVGSLVALRKESVDRNRACTMTTTICIVSLSARRAWIEMGVHYDNYNLHWSLSARRAWIEIALLELIPLSDPSLSARRAWIEIWWLRCWQLAARGRSPQGERG